MPAGLWQNTCMKFGAAILVAAVLALSAFAAELYTIYTFYTAKIRPNKTLG